MITPKRSLLTSTFINLSTKFYNSSLIYIKRDNARVEKCEFRLSVDTKTERRSWDTLEAFELESQILHWVVTDANRNHTNLTENYLDLSNTLGGALY